MNFKEYIQKHKESNLNNIELFGWLVDKSDGLYLFDQHFQENIDSPYFIKFDNPNLMYCIKELVPLLGGGKSSLFYKAKVFFDIEAKNNEMIIFPKTLKVSYSKNFDNYIEINISIENIKKFVDLYGEYKFIDRSKSNISGDWLDDLI